MKYINSWKNKEVFEDQLTLNEKELNDYPPHWKHFLYAVNEAVGSRRATILDVGCGAGVYKELCKTHLPNVQYTGMDYSSEAIEVAQEKWGRGFWKVGSYESLTSEDSKIYSILHAGAMLDVLPNGDEALEFLLSLGFSNIILGRCKLTEEKSHFSEYQVYNKIQTYAYSHNIQNFFRMVDEAKYSALLQGEQNSCTILLQKLQ